MVQRKAMYNHLMELKGNIRVFCRVRPLIHTGPSAAATNARGGGGGGGSHSGLMQLPPVAGQTNDGLQMGLIRFGDEGEIELKSGSDGRRTRAGERAFA